MSEEGKAGTEEPGLVAGDEEPVTGTDEEAAGTWPTSMPQPGRRDLMVWVAMVLMGCLILLVVFVNVGGIRANAGMTMATTDWQLKSYADATGILVPTLSDPAVTIRFGQDGSVSGVAGCNHYAATYTTKDYNINITNLAESAMYCPEPGVMAQETSYLADLTASTDFRLSDTFLKTYSKTGKPLLVFIAGS
jgi:heat shock protein HslJ